MEKIAGIKKRGMWFSCVFLALVSVISAVPLYYVLLNAFKKPEFIQVEPLILTPGSFTLANLARTFRVMRYPEALMNNVILLVITCSILVVIGSMAGYAIAVSGSRVLNTYYLISVLVITVPFQIMMVPLIIIMKKTNLINNYFGTSLVYVAVSLPIVIFLYTGFMRSLPKELSEAAIVDGCGMIRTYIYIFMPLMKVVTGTVLILRGQAIWNDLLVPILTISKSSMTPLPLRLYAFASQRLTSWDLVFGGTLLCSLPVIALFLSLQKYFIHGIVAGAVKG